MKCEYCHKKVKLGKSIKVGFRWFCNLVCASLFFEERKLTEKQ